MMSIHKYTIITSVSKCQTNPTVVNLMMQDEMNFNSYLWESKFMQFIVNI